MFRKDLERRLKTIFDFAKTTYLEPVEPYEQDTLFIEIESARPRTSRTEKTQSARVLGHVVVFSQDNRLPYGFFAKRLEQAEAELKKNLHFFNMDTDDPTSPARMVNVHERRASFIFLYESQYDPDQGSLTSLEF